MEVKVDLPSFLFLGSKSKEFCKWKYSLELSFHILLLCLVVGQCFALKSEVEHVEIHVAGTLLRQVG